MSRASRKAFDERVARSLGDPLLQRVVADGQDYMQELNRQAREELDWAAWTEAVAAVRSHTVANLDFYAERFAANVERRGGHVFFAATAAEATSYVAGVVRAKGARLVVKGKSMVSEEIGLNAELEAAGVELLETDLGEFIVQLAHERPFHIVRPAIHKSLSQIRALFSALAGEELAEDPEALAGFAKRVMRQKFLAADVGITGCNFGIASTGTVVLVTNEGNGRMTTTLPKTHIVVMGVERLVPDWESLEPILRLLPWAGVGKRVTSYVTAITGPRRPGDADGPEDVHVVIVDNGRSAILGTKYQEILHCIRCGACLDVCPVFRKIGGHSYGAVYGGPFGSVLSPLLEGLERHLELPFASSLCGACSEVCPARIPLADYLLELRCDAVRRGLTPSVIGVGLGAYAAVSEHPQAWGVAERVAQASLRLLDRRWAGRLDCGLLGRWTSSRDLPAPEGRTFRDLWRLREPGVGRDGPP